MSGNVCGDEQHEWLQMTNLLPHPSTQTVQSLSINVNSIANCVSALSPTNTSSMSMSAPPLQYPTLPVPVLYDPQQQQPQQQQRQQQFMLTQAPSVQHMQYPQYVYPHAHLQTQMQNMNTTIATWTAASSAEKEDDTMRVGDPQDKKRFYSKRKEPATKSAPKEGSRLFKQQEEIESVRKALTEPLLALVQTIQKIVPAVATYPSSERTWLNHYLPCGTDTSKDGMQQQNRNPVLPHVFYKSMEEEVQRIVTDTLKQISEQFGKYVNKYRHRHVNNRRKHLSTNVSVSKFEKSPSQLHHERLNLEAKTSAGEKKEVVEERQEESKESKDAGTNFPSITTTTPTTTNNEQRRLSTRKRRRL